MSGRPAEDRQFVEHPDDAGSRERSVHLDRGAFPRKIVHDVQRTEPPPCSQAIAHEVHGPPLVHTGRNQHRRGPHLGTQLFPFPAHFQPFLGVEPVDPFMVGGHVLALQHHAQAPIPEAKPPMGQRPHSLPDRAIPLVPTPVPVRQAGDPDQRTGPALADAFFPGCIHSLPPLRMRQYFFDRACLRASISRAWSATIRFSRLFSASKVLSRWTSEISMSAYLAFQR